MEIPRSLDPADDEIDQRTPHSRDRLVTIGRPYDQFGEHWVVVETDLASDFDPAIPPYPRPARQMQVLHPSRRGQKVVGGVFTGDATFDRPAARDYLFLSEPQPFSRGDAQLPLHEIDSRHKLGHGMFDLDARVHLEKIEIPGLVQQELASTGVDVARGPRHSHRAFAHSASQVARYGHARRLFDHLLMPALHRAFTLAERDHLPVGVGEDLDFHVTRPGNELLQIDGIVAEGALGFSSRRIEGTGEIFRS